MTVRRVLQAEIECENCRTISDMDRHPKTGHRCKPIGWGRLSLSEKSASGEYDHTSLDLCPKCVKTIREGIGSF